LLDAFVPAGFNLIGTADAYSRFAPGNRGGESETLRSDHPKERARSHTEVALSNLSNAPWRNACGEGENLFMNVASPRKSSSNARTKWEQIRTYAQLQEQLHRDLLAQHPEWIDADGSCPACDFYDERVAELISWFESAARKSITQAT
jgi:hypothetical protein